MFVRSFQLADYKAVTELFEEVLSESCYEETMKAFARQLKWDGELVLVAEVNNEIAGIIIGTIDNNKGYYYRIAVSKEHRGIGIGKALIEGMRSKFVSRKVSKILVSADQHNEQVLPLYESLGYQAGDFWRSLRPLSIVTG